MGLNIPSDGVGVVAVPPLPSPTKRAPSDGVYATAILSPARLLAVFYWARYIHYGKPLVLCDYDVAPLDENSWQRIADQLEMWRVARLSRSRFAFLFVESELIAVQVAALGINVRVIPDWLTMQDAWPQLAQSVAAALNRRDVGYLEQASERMDKRPFLNEAGVVAGPRGDDPLVPAFLYGVVLALDEAAARNPKPKQPIRSSRK
jgi:hypothetical protein